MQKKDVFDFCKQCGFKKKKSQTMGPHTHTVFTKGPITIYMDHTVYSERTWALHVNDGVSNMRVCDIEEVGKLVSAIETYNKNNNKNGEKQ